MSAIDGATVTQVFPVKRQAPLEGLYLAQDLQAMARRLGRSVVVADFIADENGVVAKADRPGHFRVPSELKNSLDWRLFQELLAQADVMISAGSYFRRRARPGNAPQEVLHQYEPGREFASLGQWRLDAGYPNRSPDLAVISRRLDFALPADLLEGGRKVAVFTTDAMADTAAADALRNAGALVLASGKEGASGESLVSTLADVMGYRVIMMVSGPSALALLLAADRLDLLYITRAHVKIPSDDPALLQTLIPGNLEGAAPRGFELAHEYVMGGAIAEDGSHFAQSFLRYDREGPRTQE